MREQQQSKLPKKGETESHRKAKDRLVNILIDKGYEVFPDSGLWINWSHLSQNGTNLRRVDPFGGQDYGYYHEFDVYARRENDNELVSELVIEIDGKSHTSKPQKVRDNKAERYANFFLPDAKFKRIPISELLGEADDKSIVDFYGLK